MGVKIAAGALAAVVAVGGAGIYLSNRNDPPASTPPTESAMPSTFTPSTEVETVSPTDEAYQAYEELLALGVTETGMVINYYTYLDLNSDGVPELLVSDADGTSNSWSTGVLYTYKDSALQIGGETNSRYEPFYLVNGKYLLGCARMGNQFFSCDESLIFTIYHWNEEKTCNDPAVRRDGNDWEYITEAEFEYYRYLPDEATVYNTESFIKTAEPIQLKKNTFCMPTDDPDSSTGWIEITTTVPDDFVGEYLVLEVIALNTGEDHAFQILRENNYTLHDKIPVGTYLIDLVFVYQDYRYHVTTESNEFTVTSGLTAPIRLNVEMYASPNEKFK